MVTSGQRGYVLAATLWMLALVAVAATYFAERVARSVELARQSREMTEALGELEAGRAEILFRLATESFSEAGLGTGNAAIVLDNRPYRFGRSSLLRFQDERGLLNVNFVEPALVMNLLGQIGVPSNRWQALLDSLADYTDTDSLRRLNGAEAPEYAAAGLPPPPNDWLATPHELRNILGWREREELWRDGLLLRLTTTSRVIGFNPNTAPPEVLASLPGANRDVAEAILRRRALAPIRSPAELAALLPAAAQMGDFIVPFPAGSVRITQSSGKMPWAVQFSVTPTPAGESAPWRIDYHARTEIPSLSEDEDKIPILPPRPGALAAEAPPF